MMNHIQVYTRVDVFNMYIKLNNVFLPHCKIGCGLSKTDLIFILDASTSVTESNFQKMRDFLKRFLRNADIDSGSVRVGVNIYSTDVQVVFHLNE